MNWLAHIPRYFANDPYHNGPSSRVRKFRWERSYPGTTEFGFKFRYRIACIVEKINHEAFRSARMLEDSSQSALIDEWRNQVFVPTLRRLRYSFRFFFDRLENLTSENPAGCFVVKDNDGSWVYWDTNSHRLLEELHSVPFQLSGCKVLPSMIALDLDEKFLKEGYDMIKLRKEDSFENSESYRKYEEGVAVTFLNRFFELKQKLQRSMIEQEHRGNEFSVKVHGSGSTIEISWNLNGYAQHPDYVLRGYRSNDGFANYRDNLPAQGTFIAESRTNGKVVQELEPGREYFYTFLLTKDEPIPRQKGLIDTFREVIGCPVIVGTKTSAKDSIRFSVQIPSRNDISKLDDLMNVNRDAERLKNEQALNALRAFVQFEETISEVEKEIVAQIKAKNYPRDEEEDRIGRFRDVVAMLRSERT